MDRRWARATAAALATLVLVAAGCGGSSGPSAGPSTTTTTTSARSSAPATTGTTSSGSTAAGATTTTSTATTSPPARASAVTGVPGDPVTVKPAVPATAPVTTGTVATPDGRTRTYRLYVPTTVTGGTGGAPVPLLVALHGGTGWGAQFERNSGFDGLAEANGFIVVYPDGIGIGARGDQLRTWNGGDCCGPATKQNVDDVGFIRMLIARIESEHAIDRTRVFAGGHSNGGILSLRLACELSDQIVAIGVQSAALEISSCQPSTPVSVLQIHGSGDQNVPIDGGVGPNAISGVAFNVPKDAATTLARGDGCGAPADSTDPSNTDITITGWATCTGGAQVAFVQVAGAPHAWMGHTTAIPGKVGTPYPNLDSSLAIWNFLSQHPRP